MSDTYLWSFGFYGRGLPAELSRALLKTAADRQTDRGHQADWGDLDAGLFPDLPIQELLRDAAFACLRAETAHFVPESGASAFFWRASVALHDDLAMQSEEFFFPWLCQYSSRDGFFGVVMNDQGVSPALLFAVDQAAVWVTFERGDGGYPSGALSADALRRVLSANDEASSDQAFSEEACWAAVEIGGLAAKAVRRRWSTMAALFN